MSDVKHEAEYLIAKGLRVVPLKPRSKEPYEVGWNAGQGSAFVFAPEDFGADDNLGIRSIDGVVVIDVDAAEAVQVADAFLPKTGLIYGRPSKPRSKWLYLSTFERMQALRAADGTTIIEIRVKHHDMAPPSTHPNGELLAWDVFEDLASIDAEVLLRAVRLIATCVLVIRSYAAEGARHDWGLAWWGTLRHLGLTEVEVTTLAEQAARVAGDTKAGDRVTEVRSTFARSDDSPLKSEGALKDQTTPETLKALKEVWGLSHRNVKGFITDKNDQIIATNTFNIRHAIKMMRVRVAFNDFSGRHIVYFRAGDRETARPLSDTIDRQLYVDCVETFGFRPPRELFTEMLLKIGDEATFHPVQDYLKSLTWDGIARLDTWLIRHASAADNAYVRAVSALPLLAACRRVMAPGTKFDEMLVLESGQGQGKSTTIQALCPFEEWFSSDLPLNSDSKEIIERTNGKWLIEAADLSGLKKADVEQLKAMLSREVDNARMAYGRHANDRRRQWVIIGTTNHEVYLKDTTGNRRFWPVQIKPMSAEAVATERDQLWAEAYARERAGESIHLPKSLWGVAAVQQDRRRSTDPWESILTEAFGATPGTDDQQMPNEAVWAKVGMTDISRYTPRDQHRLTEIMQRLGFRRQSIRLKIDGTTHVTKGWKRPGTSPLLPTDDPRSGSL